MKPSPERKLLPFNYPIPFENKRRHRRFRVRAAGTLCGKYDTDRQSGRIVTNHRPNRHANVRLMASLDSDCASRAS